MISSFSYWIAECLIDVFAQNFFHVSGSFVDQSTVIFGSGAAPILLSVLRYLYDIFVTMCLPSTPIPPNDSVTHVGSPANNELYSGVRANLIQRSFMTN